MVQRGRGDSSSQLQISGTTVSLINRRLRYHASYYKHIIRPYRAYKVRIIASETNCVQCIVQVHSYIKCKCRDTLMLLSNRTNFLEIEFENIISIQHLKHSISY